MPLYLPTFVAFFHLPSPLPSTTPHSLPPDLTVLSEGDPVPFSLERRALYWQVEHNGRRLPSPPSASRAE